MLALALLIDWTNGFRFVFLLINQVNRYRLTNRVIFKQILILEVFLIFQNSVGYNSHNLLELMSLAMPPMLHYIFPKNLMAF